MSRSLPRRTVYAYGVPILGLSYLLFFVQFYFLKFATDVLLLAPAGVGALFGAAKLWDAISDPWVGHWSDRTVSRMGRRRPWMFGALPFLALSFWMLWSPPGGLVAWPLLLWVGGWLVALYTAFTVYAVPHTSLGTELTRDHHERTRVFGVRHVTWTLGMFAAFGAIQWVSNAASPRSSTSLAALSTGVLAVALLAVVPALVREPARHVGRGAESLGRALRDVVRNPHARLLLLVWFVENLGAGVLGVLSPYFAQYVLGRPDLIGALPAIYVLAGVLSIPAWVVLSKRHGKQRVWLVAMLGTAASFGATLAVGEGDVLLLGGLLGLAGVSMGCGGAVGKSILSDVIDSDELRTGERKEGTYAAVWGFVLKLSIGLVTAGVGVALGYSGFEPNVEQSPLAEGTIRWLFGGVPLVAFGVGAVLFRRFRLDEEAHVRIQAELARRESSASERSRSRRSTAPPA